MLERCSVFQITQYSAKQMEMVNLSTNVEREVRREWEKFIIEFAVI